MGVTAGARWLAVPIWEWDWEDRGRAGQLQRARFSKIENYLRDNRMWIHLIRFEGSSQQESGIGARVGRLAPTLPQRTRERVGHPKHMSRYSKNYCDQSLVARSASACSIAFWSASLIFSSPSRISTL